MANLLTIALVNVFISLIQLAFGNVTHPTAILEEDVADNHSLTHDLDSWIQPFTFGVEDESLNVHESVDARRDDERPIAEAPTLDSSAEDDDSNQLLPPEEDDKSDSSDGCPDRCPLLSDPPIKSETESTNSSTTSSGDTTLSSTTTVQPTIENHIPVEDPRSKETSRSFFNDTDSKETVLATPDKKSFVATTKTTPISFKTNEIVTSEFFNKSWVTLSPPTVRVTVTKTANWTKTFANTVPHHREQPINVSTNEMKISEVPATNVTEIYRSYSEQFVSNTTEEFVQNVTEEFVNETTELPVSSRAIPAETTTEETSPTYPSTAVTINVSETERINTTSSSTEEPENKNDEVSAATFRPRLTNPNCLLLPVCVKVEVVSEPSMCSSDNDDDDTATKAFRTIVGEELDRYINPDIRQSQIVLEIHPCPNFDAATSVILFFVTDPSGEYEESLTAIAGVLLKKIYKSGSSSVQIVDVDVLEKEEGVVLSREVLQVTPPPLASPRSGMVAAVAISAVAGACLCLLCVLLLVMKHRLAQQGAAQQQQQRQGMDSYSLDSFSINASFRRRAPGGLRNSAFLNHAFSHDDDDVLPPSKPMTMSALATVLANRRKILEQEFEKLPMNTHKLDEVPTGAEGKNRYANVVPNPKTRVLLCDKSDDPVKSYINANYVKGQNGRAKFYIACQAPLPEYSADFWQMIWEQQTRLILMLTNLQENGISRCAAYFPESTLNCRQVHGNYEVSLLKKDVREFYTASTLNIVDVEKNSSREMRHLWYKAWPAVGLPSDPSSLVSFLLQARPFINSNLGPTVIHCSAGTGRTGVVIALDMCMREYESLGCVDVVRCVARIRMDRGGAVQNKDQYLLVHDALLDYALSTANQSHRASLCSNN